MQFRLGLVWLPRVDDVGQFPLVASLQLGEGLAKIATLDFVLVRCLVALLVLVPPAVPVATVLPPLGVVIGVVATWAGASEVGRSVDYVCSGHLAHQRLGDSGDTQ